MWAIQVPFHCASWPSQKFKAFCWRHQRRIKSRLHLLKKRCTSTHYRLWIICIYIFSIYIIPQSKTAKLVCCCWGVGMTQEFPTNCLLCHGWLANSCCTYHIFLQHHFLRWQKAVGMELLWFPFKNALAEMLQRWSSVALKICYSFGPAFNCIE